jgi:hypothetical protein
MHLPEQQRTRWQAPLVSCGAEVPLVLVCVWTGVSSWRWDTVYLIRWLLGWVMQCTKRHKAASL